MRRWKPAPANRIFSASLGFLAAACLVTVGFAQAQPAGFDRSPASAPAVGDPILLDTRQLATPAGQQAASALLRKAQELEQVHVIVGLDLAIRDETELTPAQEDDQARALRRAQDDVAWRSAIPARMVVRYETIPYMAAAVTRTQLGRLIDDPGVVSIQADFSVAQMPPDGAPPPDAGPMLAESVPLIKAHKLWQQGFRGEGMIVAVLSTGAEYTHPMLRGKVVAGLCRSGGVHLFCPNNTSSSDSKASGKNCNPAVFSGCEWGTRLSSIAAGKSGVLRGVAREAQLISGQVYTGGGFGLSIRTIDVIGGLDRVLRLAKKFPAAAAGRAAGDSAIAAVVVDYNEPALRDTACDALVPAMTDIINRLFRRGIATVISSGHSGGNSGITFPACIDKAIAVGSTTKDDAVSSFSAHHALVDLMAPGSSINAATLGGGYQVLVGRTNLAAAHVAGAFALLRQVRPNATVNQILKALRNGVPVTRNDVTKPRIDLVKAKSKLEKILPAAPASGPAAVR